MIEPAKDRRPRRSGSAAPAPAANIADSRVARLWLDVLEDLVGRAAHELKGALNGVAVSLEVVRVRVVKPAPDGTSVERFARSAAEQLEVLTRRTDALLMLARQVREPVEVTVLLARLVTLLGPAVAATGGSLRLEERAEALPPTTAPGNTVRLVLAAALLDAIADDCHVLCSVSVKDGEVVVEVAREGFGAPGMRDEVQAVARESGIAVDRTADRLTIRLPAAVG